MTKQQKYNSSSNIKRLYHAVVDSMWQHIDITNDVKSWQGSIAAWTTSPDSAMLPSCGNARHKHWDGCPGRDRRQVTQCSSEPGIYTCRQLWVTGISQALTVRCEGGHWNCAALTALQSINTQSFILAFIKRSFQYFYRETIFYPTICLFSSS